MKISKKVKALQNALGIESINDLNENISNLAPQFKSWFSAQDFWSDTEPKRSLEKLQVVLNLPGESRSKPDLVLQLLGEMDLPPILYDQEGKWPFPIQSCLDRLEDVSSLPKVSEHNTFFEACLHLHFTCMASQFHWCLDNPDISQDKESIQAGIASIYHALASNTSGGGILWAHWSFLLSRACQEIESHGIALPFPEFSSVTPSERCKFSPKRTKDSNVSWDVSSGNETWEFYFYLVKIRNEFFHFEELSSYSLQKIILGLNHLVDLLLNLFLPYQDLMIGMVSEMKGPDKNPVHGIDCCWLGTKLVYPNNPRGKRQLEKWWNKPAVQGYRYLPAPIPPKKDFCWNESLLLFDPNAAYSRTLYLMPLGFRFGQGTYHAGATALPGLVNTVLWQRSKVKSIVQRSYRGLLPSDGTISEPSDGSNEHKNAVNFIQNLVLGLDRFGFKLPEKSLSLTQQKLVPKFDLDHQRGSLRNAHLSIFRPKEVARILSALYQSPEQRMFLEAPAGAGKSILMAQLSQELRANCVYISFDHHIEPLADPEDSSANQTAGKLAVSLRMHYLACLSRISGMDPPVAVLSASDVRSMMTSILDQLAKTDAPKVVVLIDGLNQAPDPISAILPWPEPLPENLFVLASIQPQDQIRKQVTAHGKRPFYSLQLSPMEWTEAMEMVKRGWNPRGEKHLPELPENLYKQLLETSQGIPLLLNFWGQCLRSCYQANPKVFASLPPSEIMAQTTQEIPQELIQKFEEVTRGYEPTDLPYAIFWVLSLVGRPMTLDELVEGIDALSETDYLNLGGISPFQIELCLSALGGFVIVENLNGRSTWKLLHELIGKWFQKRYGHKDSTQVLRYSLAGLGVHQLPPHAAEQEVRRWENYVVNNEPQFNGLPIDSQVALLDALLGRLDSTNKNFADILSRVLFILLHVTGDQQRAESLQTVVEDSLNQDFLSDSQRVELYYALGDLERKAGKIEQAKNSYENCLKIAEEVVSKDSSSKNRLNLSTAYIKQGEILCAIGGVGQESAICNFTKALEVREALLCEIPTPQNKLELCHPLHYLGHNMREAGELSDALKYHKYALRLCKEVAGKSQSPFVDRLLSHSLLAVGNVYLDLREYNQAKKIIDSCYEIRRKLLTNNRTQKHEKDFAIAKYSLGTFFSCMDNYMEAEKYFEAFLSVLVRLKKQKNTYEYRQLYSVGLLTLGRNCLFLKKYREADDYLSKSLNENQILFQIPSFGSVRILAYSLHFLGQYYADIGDHSKASELLKEALSHRLDLVKTSPVKQYQSELYETCQLLGSTYGELKKPELAKKFQDKAIELFPESPPQSLIYDLVWDTGF